MKFIDLFAGLGGFHLALNKLGHDCVFASELDESLQSIYSENFGIKPAGDIRLVPVEAIPSHDILCAGFPCQPFSKAGYQQGFMHPKWGDLWSQVVRIASHHQPQYLILENVPNLTRHANGQTWKQIEAELRAIGYDVKANALSPHRFGIPQIRERVYIVASRGGLQHFTWPVETHLMEPSVHEILDSNPPDARPLSGQVIECLEVWQDFLDRYPQELQLPSYPIWSMEFAATYPYLEATPWVTDRAELRTYRGSHGIPLADLPDGELFQALPSYARVNEPRFPGWKIDFIRKNRSLYEQQRAWIDAWLPKILKFPSSLQKFEWNCKGVERNVWNLVIQFRASGVRVKKPTTSPSLIAMNTTQVPIIAWERRYMTPREASRLQSMDELKVLPLTQSAAFKALGNAVNTEVVRLIAQALLDSGPAMQMPVEAPIAIPEEQLPLDWVGEAY